MPESHSASQNDSDETQDYQVFEEATARLRKKLIFQKRRQEAQYQLVSIAFNLLAIAQVIIAAAITALGPSGDEHMLAITILGACNTTFAGLLALLKGRGLPQRLRSNMNELARVLDHIEEQKILLRYGNSRNPKDGLVVRIEDALRRYTIAEDTIEGNQPDTYTSRNSSQSSAGDTEADNHPSKMIKKGNACGKRREVDEEMATGENIHL